MAAGCEVVLPGQKMFWGDLYGQVRDPFGVMWAMNQPEGWDAVVEGRAERTPKP